MRHVSRLQPLPGSTKRRYLKHESLWDARELLNLNSAVRVATKMHKGRKNIEAWLPLSGERVVHPTGELNHVLRGKNGAGFQTHTLCLCFLRLFAAIPIVVFRLKQNDTTGEESPHPFRPCSGQLPAGS